MKYSHSSSPDEREDKKKKYSAEDVGKKMSKRIITLTVLLAVVIAGANVFFISQANENVADAETEAREKTAEIQKDILNKVNEALPANEGKTFEMQDGDTTYIMKEYFMCFLMAGPNREQDEATTQKIQERHMAHLDKLAKEGYIDIAGPFGDDGEYRGIAIYKNVTLEEAIALAEDDPAVKAGRIKIEMKPVWLAKGSTLR